MASSPYLSIVIPAYREERRIGPTLDRILAFLREKTFSWEVLVVDDGSRDGTAAIAQIKLNSFPHRILRQEKNQGKGAAVKCGMLEAEGEYLLFTDADLSTPIEEVVKLLDPLAQGFDLAIGSRGLKGARVEVHQNFLRESMGKIFNRLARLATFKEIKDSQCGFKCFRRSAARELFGAQRIRGFAFDAEILYLAQKKGFKIVEVPIVWRNFSNSRVHILKDSFSMLMDLIKIRWIHG